MGRASGAWTLKPRPKRCAMAAMGPEMTRSGPSVSGTRMSATVSGVKASSRKRVEAGQAPGAGHAAGGTELGGPEPAVVGGESPMSGQGAVERQGREQQWADVLRQVDVAAGAGSVAGVEQDDVVEPRCSSDSGRPMKTSAPAGPATSSAKNLPEAPGRRPAAPAPPPTTRRSRRGSRRRCRVPTPARVAGEGGAHAVPVADVVDGEPGRRGRRRRSCGPAASAPASTLAVGAELGPQVGDGRPSRSSRPCCTRRLAHAAVAPWWRRTTTSEGVRAVAGRQVDDQLAVDVDAALGASASSLALASNASATALEAGGDEAAHVAAFFAAPSTAAALRGAARRAIGRHHDRGG